MPIKFHKHYVTDGAVKARIFYGTGACYVKRADGQRVLRDDVVTLYAKDYGSDLHTLFPGKAENNSDLMTDYFEQSRVRLLPGDEGYDAAKLRADAVEAERRARQAAKDAAWRAANPWFHASQPQQVAA